MIPASEHLATQSGDLEPLYVGKIPDERLKLGAIVFDTITGQVLRCDSISLLVFNDARASTRVLKARILELEAQLAEVQVAVIADSIKPIGEI